MGDRIVVPLDLLAGAATQVRAIQQVLADLDDLSIDAAALGDPRVAAGAVEAQQGWHVQRAGLHARLGVLAGFVDAARVAASDADASIVTGRAR